MRTKCIAILIVFCMFIAFASAQDYSIRANRGLNLRAAPALTADIADTVASGAVLHVVGKSGSWLKIDRHGREVWLADWVNYSRVDSSEPSGSQQPAAQIDNCCFVDRHCQSDQEWIDGYWAYQNNQCPASPASSPQTSAQPTTNPASQVDNCCFVDRQCQTDADWLSGYWAFQNNQCPAPAKPNVVTPSRPLIEGSSGFVRQVEAALNWLESRAPEWYNYVIGGMDIIFEMPDTYTDHCTAYAYTHERKVVLGTCHAFLSQRNGLSARHDQLDIADTLAHEACHIHRYEAGFVYDESTSLHEELECTKPSIGVDVALDPYENYFLEVTYLGEPALSVVKRFCREGFSPELYCPAIQRLLGG